MPILIASIVVQVLCIVHIMRTGRERFWILIIVFFSFIGCLAYLVAEILPELFNSRYARSAYSGAIRAINPDREYREAVAQVELSPTAHNRRRLADACMGRKAYAEAIEIYRSILVGHDAHAPDLLAALAEAQLGHEDYVGALATLDELRAHNPDYQSARTHLTYARALEGAGRDEDALIEYEALERYFSGEEARCRYALLLKKLGHTEKAQQMFAEIVKARRHAPRHYIRTQREWLDIAQANLKA